MDLPDLFLEISPTCGVGKLAATNAGFDRRRTSRTTEGVVNRVESYAGRGLVPQLGPEEVQRCRLIWAGLLDGGALRRKLKFT